MGVPVALALGWALPLFGIPLAAFPLVDIAIEAIRGRRARPRPKVPVSPAPAGS